VADVNSLATIMRRLLDCTGCLARRRVTIYMIAIGVAAKAWCDCVLARKEPLARRSLGRKFGCCLPLCPGQEEHTMRETVQIGDSGQSVDPGTAGAAAGKSKIVLLLLLIILIASFLRLHGFTSAPPGLFFDEAADGNNALEVTHTIPFWSGFKPFYPEDNGREGLYVNAVAILIKLTGGIHEPWILRLPAAISGILTVLGIYFFAAELFGLEIGLLSAFLLAISFWHINFSRIAFRAIMAPLFLTWSLYLLFNGFNLLGRGVSFRRATSLHFLGGILFGLGMYTYLAYRVSPVLVLLVFAFYWRLAKQGGWQTRFLRSAAYFVLSSVVVFLPLGLYFYSHPGSFSGYAARMALWNRGNPLRDLVSSTVHTLAMFNIAGDPNWRHNLQGSPELSWPVGQLFLFGLFQSCCLIQDAEIAMHDGNAKFRSTWRRFSGMMNRDCFPVVILFAWFFVAMLPVVLSGARSPHALRSILMLPPVIMFAALGGFWLYQQLQKRIRPAALKVIVIILLAFLTANAYRAYFVVWAQNPGVPFAFSNHSVLLARELDALPAETPKYVVVQPLDDLILVRGIPISAQSTMFITDTFRPEEQKAKNIHYLLPAQEGTIPAGALKFYLRDGL